MSQYVSVQYRHKSRLFRLLIVLNECTRDNEKNSKIIGGRTNVYAEQRHEFLPFIVKAKHSTWCLQHTSLALYKIHSESVFPACHSPSSSLSARAQQAYASEGIHHHCVSSHCPDISSNNARTAYCSSSVILENFTLETSGNESVLI